MISNQASIPANMGNLFQIFNLPKAGGSSYLFSDIIKVIGNEADLSNSLTGVNPSLAGHSIITSAKLLNLLNDNLDNRTMLTGEQGFLNEKLCISEEELKSFLDKLGLANTFPKEDEVVIELSPEILNKLKNIISGNKKEKNTQSFITLDPGSKQGEILMNEIASAKEDKTKIKIVFKKIEEEPVTQPLQQLANTSIWQNNILLKDEEPVQINLTQKGDALPDGLQGETASSFSTRLLGEAASNISSSGPNQTGTSAHVNLVIDETSPAGNQSTDKASAGKINLTTDNSPLETENDIELSSVYTKETEIEKAIKGTIISQSTNTPEVKDEIEKSVQRVPGTNDAETNIGKIAQVKKDNLPQESLKDVTDMMPEENLSDNSIKAANLKNIDNNIKKDSSNVNETRTFADIPAELKKSGVNISNSGEKLDAEIKIGEKNKLQLDNNEQKGLAFKSQSSEQYQIGDEDREVNSGGFLENKRYRKTFGNMFNEHQIEVKQVHLKSLTEQKAIYEISFEGNDSAIKGKILPHDFATTDYEDFSSGILVTKNTQHLKETTKELKQVDNPVNIEKIQEHTENKNTSSESSLDNSAKGNSNSGLKSAGKSVTETPFADHLSTRNNITNEVINSKHEMPAKEYTSLFKNIDSSELIEEVKNLIIRGDKTNITLKLSPEHLGSVKLTIDIKDSIVNTNIEVENESVKQVVQNNIESLKQTLQQNGIQLQSFSISLSQQEQKTPGKPLVKKKAQQENGEISIKDEVKTSAAKNMGYNTYEYLA